MKSFFNFLKNILVVLNIGLGLFFAYDYFFFLDKMPVVSPLDKDVRLVVRNDIYGEGRFAAARSGRRQHNGIDFCSPIGRNVHAVKSGWVVVAREQKGYGNYIEIYHGKDLITTYAHLNSIKVKALEHVRQGQVVGTVGKTGNAISKRILPHLHFEVIKNGQYIDPATREWFYNN